MELIVVRVRGVSKYYYDRKLTLIRQSSQPGIIPELLNSPVFTRIVEAKRGQRRQLKPRKNN